MNLLSTEKMWGELKLLEKAVSWNKRLTIVIAFTAAVYAPLHVCFRELQVTLEKQGRLAEVRYKDGTFVYTILTMSSILNNVKQ